MIKKILSIAVLMSLCLSVSAKSGKVAIVDVQEIVNKSAQVQELKKEQDAKRQEIAEFINKAQEEINKQTDETKKQELINKYDKELAAKREADIKEYSKKLAEIDKSISNTVVTQAKAMGYDLVLAKSIVLYGGTDITEAISKVVK